MSDFEALMENALSAKMKGESLESAVEKVQKILPEQRITYKPSGKFTTRTLPIMIVTAVISGLVLIYPFDLYIGFIQGYTVAQNPIARGVDYGSSVGYTFYLLFLLLGSLIALSLGGTIVSGKIGKNRNELVATIVSAIPSIVVLLYLFLVAQLHFDSEGYHAFITSLTFLTVVAALLAILGTYVLMGQNNFFDERTNKFLKIWKSEPLMILAANQLKQHICEKKYDDVVNLIGTASLQAAQNKRWDNELNSITLTIYKLSDTDLYEYGYLKGDIKFSISYRSFLDKITIARDWTFMFVRLPKKEIELLSRFFDFTPSGNFIPKK